MKQTYDVVVIGAGSGGLTAASGFNKIGKKVLLIEREHMGGECTNSGCIPSKALLHHAKTFCHTYTLAGDTEELQTFRKKAFDQTRSIIHGVLEHETPEVFKAQGIDVAQGEAEFVSPCSVKVGEQEYEFKHAVIATGSSPRTLSIAGVEEKDILTNQNLFALERLPAKLLIVGGGPIGLEMGQAFAMLGSQVTILDISDRFARLEDPAISKIAHEHFESLGISIHLGASIERVENKLAFIKKGDKNVQVAYDKLLFAVGRVPNLPLGLALAGIRSDEHGILVDSQHRTSNKSVYAVGDVASRLKFTHTADDSARAVVTRVASHGLLWAKSNKAVPKVTYTEPEMAQVGLSYAEAQNKYPESELMRIEVPFSEVDRAVTDRATDGLLVVVARRLSGVILGANLIGPRAGELITPFTLAIDHKISLWSLRSTIYAYPTYSLIIKKAGDKFLAEQMASLRTDLFNLLKRNAPKFVAALLWLTLLWQLYSYQTSHDMTVTDTALMVFDFVTMTAWGPLVYILFYAIRPVTFFPATALTILAGVFFGLWWGAFLTVIAATLSASVAYGVGRFFGSDLKLEDSVFGNWVEALRENTFEAILTMRLIFLPFDGISYAAGILKTSFLPFVGATFLGILLGTTTFVSIGASLDIEEFKMDGISLDIVDPWYIALSGLILVVSIGLARLLRRWRAQ